MTGATAAGEFRRLPVASLWPSPHNVERAKRYDKAQLQELADSIKQNGLAQPILVTPVPVAENSLSTDRFVIVAGERRWRAHQLAGLPEIDAVVRELTDKQVLELQLIENLQRQDVHPLQEADGYEELLHKHGLTVDALAHRLGKSKSYVFARLKLRALCQEARDAFYEGKFGAEIALLIARIPVKDLQKKAAKAIVNGHGDGPWSFRAAREHIHRNYMLRLSDASFPIKDASLLKSATACTVCPKRTGNQPELFGDVDSADVCTDPECFAAKTKTHAGNLLAAAKADGRQTFTGAAAKKIIPHEYSGIQGGWVEVDRKMLDLGSRSPKQALGKDMPATALVEHPHTGAVMEIVDQKALAAALKAKGLVRKLPAPSGADDTYQAQQRAREKKAKRESEVRRRIMLAVRDKVRANPTDADVRMVAEAFFADIWHESRKKVLQLWSIDTKGGEHEKKVGPAIAKMSSADVAVFLVDCALATELHVGPYDTRQAPRLLDAAKRHKVDVDAIRKAFDAEQKAKAKPTAKAAKKPAAKKAKK